MNLRKKLVVLSLALVLASKLYANKLYTVETSSLENAISEIAKKAEIPYLVDTNILKGKKAKRIKDIQGLENALESILEDTGLEAVIENNMIIIKKKSNNSSKNKNNLGQVEIVASSDSTTEGTNSYTTQSMNTATKLNLSIKETPQSVSVVTNQQIKDFRIDSLQDLVMYSTGLDYETFDTERNSFYSRGFEISNFKINGIKTNFSTGFGGTKQNSAIYDRVEILRGADGLLSGDGTPAATINYIRKKANNKDFNADISLSAGSWDNYNTTIDLSSGLNKDGSIRGRFILDYEDSKSFIDFYNEENSVFLGTIEADLSDNTLLTAGISYQSFKAKGSSWGALPEFYSDGTKTNFSRKQSSGASWTGRENIQTDYFASLEHIFSNDIKVNGSYSHRFVDGKSDLLYIYASNFNKETGLGMLGSPRKYTKDDTTEDNFDLYTSVPFEIGNQNHEFIAGVSYNKKFYETISQGTSSDIALGDYNNYKGTPKPSQWLNKTPWVNETIKKYSLYSAMRLSLNDNLKFILGGRLSTYKYDSKIRYGSNGEYREFENEFTPYLGLVYDINDTYSFYASYTDIFELQDEQNKKGEFLDPKTGETFEAGIKASYLDDKVNAFFNIYKIKQDNLAKEDGTNKVLDSNEQAYVGAKGATSKGIEAEISGEVIKDLNLTLGITKFEIEDAEGEKINLGTARETIKLSSTYKMNNLTFGGNINWQSEVTNEKRTQDSYYLVGLVGRYQFTNNLYAQVNVNNLFDKKYYSGVSMYGLNYGSPRRTTFSLNYKF